MKTFKVNSLFLLFSLICTQQVIALTQTKASGIQYIGNATSYFVDTTKSLTIYSIHTASEAFQPTNSNVPHFGIFKAPLWIKIQLETADTNTAWLLNIENTELDSIWYYQPNFSTTPIVQGSHYNESFKTIDLRNYYFPIYFKNGKA